MNIQLLRLANLFGGYPNNTPPGATPPFVGEWPIGLQDFSGGIQPSTPPPPSMPMGLQAQLPGQLDQPDPYTPEHTQFDIYNQLANQYPQQPQYGRLRRIFTGAMAGLAGEPQMGAEVLNAPHTNAVRDWQLKMQAAQNSAAEEGRRNANERLQIYQAQQSQLNQRKAEETERKDRATEADREVQRGIQQQRANIYQYKALHPNAKFDFSGPTVLVADPATGQVTDTKVPTGSMTDFDKLNLQNQNALEQIGARGQQAQATKATPSGTPRTQVVQPHENGVPKGNPLLIDLDTGQVIREVDTKGNPIRSSPAGRTGTETTEYDAEGKPVSKRVTKPIPNQPVASHVTADQIKRAGDFLKANGQKVTDANIKHVLDHPEKYGIR